MNEKIKLASVFLYTGILFILSSVFMYIGKDADVGLGLLIGYLVVVILGVILAYALRNVVVSLIVSLIIPSLLGYIIGPAMNMYVEKLGMDVVFLVFLGAAGIFVGAALFGFFTKRDLSKLGTYLFFSLLFVIVFIVIGVIVGFGSGLFAIISGVSLLIFTLYTAYDVFRIKQNIYTMQWYEVPLYGLDLFINLINMFLDLIRLVSYFFGED